MWHIKRFSKVVSSATNHQKYAVLWFALMVFAMLIGGAARAARAQSVSLTSGGFASVSGQSFGAPVSTSNQIGQPLSANLNFGDASPNGFANRRIVVKMPIRISSKVNYKVEVQKFSTTLNGVSARDIGFGILNARAQLPASPNLTADAALVTKLERFGTDPVAARIVNGRTVFDSTLADFSETPRTILTGAPTVVGGEVGDDSNSIIVDLVFVIIPQFFAPTDLQNLKLIITASEL